MLRAVIRSFIADMFSLRVFSGWSVNIGDRADRLVLKGPHRHLMTKLGMQSHYLQSFDERTIRLNDLSNCTERAQVRRRDKRNEFMSGDVIKIQQQNEDQPEKRKLALNASLLALSSKLGFGNTFTHCSC